ncbi:hypothetical protein B0H11DRAFT_1945397 [Mycena galericulata]|nr:hypothetical protein B0H11DRAFT_1945397 [Mycena galericulata]
MRLTLLAWLGVFLFLLLKMTSPPPTPSPSLAHRRETGVRNARRCAMSPVYSRARSPRHSPGRRALLDISNRQRENEARPGSPSADLERSALRHADRDRQLALELTPSRRRRRVPNENRALSPTPGPSRPRVEAPQGLQTPPATNAPTRSGIQRAAPSNARSEAQRERRRREAEQRLLNGPQASGEPNARSAAQRERRRREAEGRQGPDAPQPNARANAQRQRRQREAAEREGNAPRDANPPTARAAAQRARRERERQQRANGQLLTPPATQARRALTPGIPTSATPTSTSPIY